jgi:hypothetical protein
MDDNLIAGSAVCGGSYAGKAFSFIADLEIDILKHTPAILGGGLAARGFGDVVDFGVSLVPGTYRHELGHRQAQLAAIKKTA